MLPDASPWIYFAAPLFTHAEIAFNQQMSDRLQSAGYRIYLPQEACTGLTDPMMLFQKCMDGLAGASMVLGILDGTDSDSGSCFELGYAYANDLALVGVRTDFRGSGEHLGLNLMLTHSCRHLLLTTMRSPAHIPDRVTYLHVGEDPLPKLLLILESLPEAQLARHHTAKT